MVDLKNRSLKKHQIETSAGEDNESEEDWFYHVDLTGLI